MWLGVPAQKWAPQPGEGAEARVPPKLETPRIQTTIFCEGPKLTFEKNVKKNNAPLQE